MARSYVILRPTATLQEWIEYIKSVKKDNSKMLYTIPFGPNAGRLVEKELKYMDWKGQKGEDFIEVAEKHGALLAANELARKISMAYSGTKGVVYETVFDPITGTWRLTRYPRKSLAQRNWKKDHPELAELYNNKVKPNMVGKRKGPRVRFVVLTS